MRDQKPVTKSFMLNSETDADILEYLERPEISISAAVREALRLFIAQDKNRKSFEQRVIALLEQVVGSGGVSAPMAEKPKTEQYDDPFLDSSL